MERVRMEIASVIVGGGPVSSVVVLRPQEGEGTSCDMQLPIRIGAAEAGSMSAAIAHMPLSRPITHDLLAQTIQALGARVVDVTVSRVEGTTFFAVIALRDREGRCIALDARPSDALALALRLSAPIFAEQAVLDTASYPDFWEVRRAQQDQQLASFRTFLDNVSPADFE